MRYRSFSKFLPAFLGLILIAQIGQVSGQFVQKTDPFAREITTQDLAPAFLERWDFGINPRLAASRSTETTPKLVRIIYLVPTDKAVRSDYQTAITNSTLHLQTFYQNELGNGLRFRLRSPVVEVYQTGHDSAWYKNTLSRPNAPQYIWFWENVLNEAFALTGAGTNDPNNRWIFHIDADVGCGQVIGGTSGVALMAANDFRGLTGEQNIPACVGENPDNSGYFRWVGGAAHEIGHSFNLPHPPGCGSQTGCTGGATAANSLMWFGYALYPTTYFLASDKQTLIASGFFSNDTTVSISGRVTRGDGRGVPNTRVLLTNQSESRYTMTNSFGYYRFTTIPGGGSYFMLASHKSHVFNVHEVTANGDLTNIDFTAQ